MRARTQITVLVSLAALTLGIGIPLFALAGTPSTESLEGTVVSVDTRENAILVDTFAGARELRGRVIMVQVPTGQVSLPNGTESLSRLLPGQLVTARVQHGSLVAQRIRTWGCGCDCGCG